MIYDSLEKVYIGLVVFIVELNLRSATNKTRGLISILSNNDIVTLQKFKQTPFQNRNILYLGSNEYSQFFFLL